MKGGVDLSGWTIEQLLAGKHPLPPWPLDRELRTRTSPDDVQAMLRAAGDAASPMRASAIQDDVPIVREMLAGELERGSGGNQYLVCDFAEALARCAKAGPFPELRQAYREMVYSFGRRFVVEAMAATDPDFPSDLAFECLWDCNEQIREVAASHIALERPGAAERLRALADDPHEDTAVRAAAAARLGRRGSAGES